MDEIKGRAALDAIKKVKKEYDSGTALNQCNLETLIEPFENLGDTGLRHAMYEKWDIDFDKVGDYLSTGVLNGAVEIAGHAQNILGFDFSNSQQVDKKGEFDGRVILAEDIEKRELAAEIINCMKGNGFTDKQKQLLHLARSKLWHFAAEALKLDNLIDQKSGGNGEKALRKLLHKLKEECSSNSSIQEHALKKAAEKMRETGLTDNDIEVVQKLFVNKQLRW